MEQRDGVIFIATSDLSGISTEKVYETFGIDQAATFAVEIEGGPAVEINKPVLLSAVLFKASASCSERAILERLKIIPAPMLIDHKESLGWGEVIICDGNGRYIDELHHVDTVSMIRLAQILHFERVHGEIHTVVFLDKKLVPADYTPDQILTKEEISEYAIIVVQHMNIYLIIEDEGVTIPCVRIPLGTGPIISQMSRSLFSRHEESDQIRSTRYRK